MSYNSLWTMSYSKMENCRVILCILGLIVRIRDIVEACNIEVTAKCTTNIRVDISAVSGIISVNCDVCLRVTAIFVSVGNETYVYTITENSKIVCIFGNFFEINRYRVHSIVAVLDLPVNRAVYYVLVIEHKIVPISLNSCSIIACNCSDNIRWTHTI